MIHIKLYINFKVHHDFRNMLCEKCIPYNKKYCIIIVPLQFKTDSFLNTGHHHLDFFLLIFVLFSSQPMSLQLSS